MGLDKPVIGISTCIDDGKKLEPGREYQYLDVSYANAVAEAGGIPSIIPCFRDVSFYEDVLDTIDGLLMTGGEDLPGNVPGETPEIALDLPPESRLIQDRTLLRGALERKLPFLGICYGMQLLNIHFGGTLYYDIPSQLPDARNHKPGDPEYRHTVNLEDGTLLKAILACELAGVNSSHHQSVREAGSGLRVAAVCDDGIIEAIEAGSGTLTLGVQWHPEKLDDESGRKLFASFVEACSLRGSS